MADYSQNPTWVDQVTVISKAALDNYEDAHAQAIRKAPATLQSVIPAADVVGLELQGRAAGTKVAASIESLALAQSAKTADYTLTNRDSLVMFDATAAVRTATLPAASANLGRIVHIGKSDSSLNGVDIAPNGADTINGVSGNLTISFQNTVVSLQAVSGGWRRI